MSEFTYRQLVTKVNVDGKVGSSKVYEIATITPLADCDETARKIFGDQATDGMLYTVRKVGSKSKGGCWYTTSTLRAL